METRTRKAKVQGIGFCPRCEPDRYEAFEAASGGVDVQQWTASLCERHGRRLRNVNAMIREANAVERERENDEKEG